MKTALGRAPIAVAVHAALALLSTSPPLALAEAGEIERFAGTFEYAGSAQERAAGQKAVEDVVAEMNVLIRGIAKTQLLKVVTPWPTIAFERSEANLSILRSDQVPAKVALDNTPQRFRNRMMGTSWVRRRFAKGALIEFITDRSSSQTNTFRLSPDGQGLVVTGHVKSNQLPRDLRFTFTYRRRG